MTTSCDDPTQSPSAGREVWDMTEPLREAVLELANGGAGFLMGFVAALLTCRPFVRGWWTNGRG